MLIGEICSNQKSRRFFVSQLRDLIEAEPVRDLERLRYRGILSAHIPQDIKARFTSIFVLLAAHTPKDVGARSTPVFGLTIKSLSGFGPGKGGSKSEFRQAAK